ncbi:Bacteriophage protein [Burkholderia pseudomallei]
MKQLAIVIFALACAAVIGHVLSVELQMVADNVRAAVAAQPSK